MVKNVVSHVGETVGIYRIIGISDKKQNGKTLHIVQCTECGQIFEKIYKDISCNRIVKNCRHNYKVYFEQDIYCKNCETKIERNGLSLSQYFKKKFCSKNCAASYNNRGVAHNQNQKMKDINFLDFDLKLKSEILDSKCLNCQAPIPNSNKFCSNQCHRDFQYKDYIKKWQKHEVTGIKGKNGQLSNYVRRYIFEKFQSKCNKCGWSETNPYTNTIPLEIEHIDGNWENSYEENLDLLCPNCHSLTSTYRGANRGHGRNITWIVKE